MPRINEYYTRLPGSYLFAEVARKVAAYKVGHPEQGIISLGIGDVTQPLVPAVVTALHAAVDEMGRAETFRGYGPEQGYAFLREAIITHDYAVRGISLDADEIFVSDGSKCDVGNIQELFGADSVVAVTDPVYPVYVDSNAMAGRAGNWDGTRWDNIVYLPCTRENGFVPDFPERTPDLIYLCYPNNPTGTVLDRAALAEWVAYARRHGAVILYDSAYEAYIRTPDIPHSIYEIDGAQEVAVEFRSFSKTAGFTGLRCAYAVVPKAVRASAADGRQVELNALWNRRQTTKYNGCPYIVQRAAEAVYSSQGREQIRAIINTYMTNAACIRDGLTELGLEVVGGVDAPYIWVRTPEGARSWEFFQQLLERANVVCTPGVGFGPGGEGYVRLTAFGSQPQTWTAMERLRRCL